MAMSNCSRCVRSPDLAPPADRLEVSRLLVAIWFELAVSFRSYHNYFQRQETLDK